VIWRGWWPGATDLPRPEPEWQPPAEPERIGRSGTILRRRGKPAPERQAFTGPGLCPDCRGRGWLERTAGPRTFHAACLRCRSTGRCVYSVEDEADWLNLCEHEPPWLDDF
jgi:hypothetical protein